MKAFPLVVSLLIPALPGSLIIRNGAINVSEAAHFAGHFEDRKDFKQYDQLLQKAKDILRQLGIKVALSKEDDVGPAIDQGLKILQQLLKLKGKEKQTQELKEIGFESDKVRIEDISSIFPVFEIHLNDLRTFSPMRDVKELLFFTNQLLLPLSVDKQVHSSLTIRLLFDRKDELHKKRLGLTWLPTRWGQSNLIRQLTSAQAELTNQNPDLKLGFLVSVPSLNRNFLGYKDNTAINFVPLITNQYGEDQLFKGGESLSAEEAIKRLSREAMSLDDRPR